MKSEKIAAIKITKFIFRYFNHAASHLFASDQHVNKELQYGEFLKLH